MQRRKGGKKAGVRGVSPSSPQSIQGERLVSELSETGGDMQGDGPKGNEGLVGGDAGNIALLSLLYTLQGIPLGLSAAVPFLLQERISYAQQGVLSLCSMPFSLKLLWAPIVDCLYLPSMGRRKSWLVPTQLVTSLVLFIGGLPGFLDEWMGGAVQSSGDTGGSSALAEGLKGDGSGEASGHHVNIYAVCAYFFSLYFLMATQDIAVDGWAITMLSQKNRGYASTCNTFGQTLGYFVSYVGFLALNSPEVCNKYLRRKEDARDSGLVDLPSFLLFWAFVFLVVTLAVWAFKSEEGSSPSDSSPALIGEELEGGSPEKAEAGMGRERGGSPGRGGRRPRGGEKEKNGYLGVEMAAVAAHGTELDRAEKGKESSGGGGEPETLTESYLLMWRMLNLRPIIKLSVVLLTVKIGYVAAEAVTPLKITEYGMPKEQLAALAPLLLPVGIALPVLVGKWTAGPRSLSYYMWGLFAKLCMLPLWALVLALTLKVFARPHGGGEESASVETPEETLAVSDNGVGASGPVIPLWFYVVLYAVSTLWDVAGQVMFVSQMSFFAKISDPSIGGTYMTFLNTIANAGGTLSRPFALTLLERLSLPSSRFWDSRCVEEATGKGVASSAFGLFWASLTHRLSAWWRGEGTGGGAGLLSSECEGEIDGFFVELAVLAGFGWIWLLFFWPVVFSLQELPETSWRVARKTSE